MLLKQGIKYGSLAYVAHEAGKVLSSRREKSPAPAPIPAPAQQPNQHHDASGYLHQSWCNGQCSQHCNLAQNSTAGTSVRAGEAEMYYNNGNQSTAAQEGQI